MRRPRGARGGVAVSGAFREAYLGLIEAARSGDSYRFANHVRESYELAAQAPMAEREAAVQAIGPVIAEPGVLPGAVADLAIVAGALVETGASPGAVGLGVLRELAANTSIALRFVEAWEHTGEDAVIEPEYVTTTDEERVAQVLAHQAGRATMAWWTSRRFAAAGVSMLTAPSVRAELAAAPALYRELLSGAERLAAMLPEFLHLASALGEVDPVAEPAGRQEATGAMAAVPVEVGEAAPGGEEPQPPAVWHPPGADLVPQPPPSAAVGRRWGRRWRDRSRH